MNYFPSPLTDNVDLSDSIVKHDLFNVAYKNLKERERGREKIKQNMNGGND